MNIEFIPSSLVKNLYQSNYYECDVWGGRGRGGSHAITEHAIFEMMTSKYFRGFFVRAVQNTVRDSLWQDFKDRLEGLSEINKFDLFKLFHLQDSEMKATYLPNGNQIKSKGFRASSKANTANMKSIAGATHVYIEETEEVGELEYNKLADSLRTIKAPIKIIRSWNPPPKEHWLVKNYYNTIDSPFEGYYDLIPKGVKGHLAIKGTYLNNIENIDHNTRARYERYKETSPKYYYTQIKGLVSDGGFNKVYNNWKRIPLNEYLALPYSAVYGLDIGDVSPNALVEVKYNDGNFYTHEILYKSSRQLKSEYPDKPNVLGHAFDILGVDKKQEMIIDGAAKDSIIELRRAGYNAFPSDKSPGSVKTRIEFINRANNFYTHTSTNLENEYNGYYLELDQYKVPIDGKPVKGNDHIMDSDAYAKTRLRRKLRITL